MRHRLVLLLCYVFGNARQARAAKAHGLDKTGNIIVLVGREHLLGLDAVAPPQDAHKLGLDGLADVRHLAEHRGVHAVHAA